MHKKTLFLAASLLLLSACTPTATDTNEGDQQSSTAPAAMENADDAKMVGDVAAGAAMEAEAAAQ